MNGLRILLEGIGILLLGYLVILWQIIVMVSCVIVAVLISNQLGLSGIYWWAVTVIVFTILNKILYYKNDSSNLYEDIVENYKEKYVEEELTE